MNATVKSVIFWVVLVVVGVGIWNLSSTFDRIGVDETAAAQPGRARAAPSIPKPS